MSDKDDKYSSLPKWALVEMLALKEGQPQGTVISNCSVQNIGVKHDEHTASAIVAIAGALKENASALGKLAEGVAGGNAPTNFSGHGIYLQGVGK